MVLQKQVAQWANNIREQANVQARLVLWDGQQLDLGQFNTPLVTVHVKGTSALPYLISPTMDKLGEAYVTGKIDLDGRLSDVINLGFELAKNTVTESRNSLKNFSKYFIHTKQEDLKAIQFHYDLSNEFYRLWLDRNMVYSCAYFENGNEDLDTAQLKKIDHILTKIKVRPGDTLLDIGCGWGALVLRAAQKFGAKCVGITLSEKQLELATQRVKDAGLEDRIEIRLQDYRDIEGQFDRITSVG
ncbi:MAG TPA: cyclopropane-fatty-acyl-phospholipid synthase family protein, partial [Methylophilaceae bacterium]|nr:cyclopropane-fatty-acyl-phospholipid synthase family protein [Methylophilaceae bacterium]